jgi:hypothetical protein
MRRNQVATAHAKLSLPFAILNLERRAEDRFEDRLHVGHGKGRELLRGEIAQHLLFAKRIEAVEPEFSLEPPDLDDDARARLHQFQDLLVEPVDLLSQLAELRMVHRPLLFRAVGATCPETRKGPSIGRAASRVKRRVWLPAGRPADRVVPEAPRWVLAGRGTAMVSSAGCDAHASGRTWGARL